MNSTNEPLRDTLFADFARRLQEACDRNRKVPAKNHGRHVFMADEFKRRGIKVSREGVRRWFAGIARPRVEKMRILADILDVDESWLSIGIESGVSSEQRKAFPAQATGAISALMGSLQMMGATVAISEGNTPEDFYAVMQGKHRKISAVPFFDVEGGLKVRFPINYRSVVTVAVFLRADFLSEYYLVSPELLDEVSVQRGGYVEIDAKPRGMGMAFGSHLIEPMGTRNELFK